MGSDCWRIGDGVLLVLGERERSADGYHWVSCADGTQRPVGWPFFQLRPDAMVVSEHYRSEWPGENGTARFHTVDSGVLLEHVSQVSDGVGGDPSTTKLISGLVPFTMWSLPNSADIMHVIEAFNAEHGQTNAQREAMSNNDMARRKAATQGPFDAHTTLPETWEHQEAPSPRLAELEALFTAGELVVTIVPHAPGGGPMNPQVAVRHVETSVQIFTAEHPTRWQNKLSCLEYIVRTLNRG